MLAVLAVDVCQRLCGVGKCASDGRCDVAFFLCASLLQIPFCLHCGSQALTFRYA
jgi:hypothetical protein